MGDYGGASSSLSAELHLKMSKKIAQLTKVIFHLNTRNEDFQMEFAHLTHVHALEQTQLTQDAAAKLKLLTEQLHAATDRAAQADARAACAKQQFLADLAGFQRQAASQQRLTQGEFQRRVQTLEEQVEQSRRAFVDRIEQLTHVAEAQQSGSFAATAATQAAHRKELEELRKQHSDEMEQVVMSSNARYTQMLGEQLHLQDALKAELAAARTAWEQRASREHETLHTQWESDRAAAQHKFDEIKQQLVGKMERLLADAETLRGQHETLRGEKEALLTTQGELQRQLKMLDLQVRQAQQETHSVRKDSDANAHKLHHTLALSTDRIDQLTQELDALKKALVGRDAALQEATKERDALQLELLRGSASLSEKHALHAQQLSERDLKLANVQAEMAALRQQAAAADAQAAKIIQTLETRLTKAEGEASDLQKKLASAELLHSSLQRDKDKLLAELKLKLEQAEAAIAAARAEQTKTLQELRATHAQAVEALQKSHTQQLETLAKDADRRVADLEAKLTQHSSASMAKAAAELKLQHAQALAQLTAAADASESKGTQEKAQLQTQIQHLQAALALKARDAADALVQVDKLTTKLRQRDAQLSEKDAMQKVAQTTQKERDETLQKQLKEAATLHESVVKRLTGEKDRLVADHKQVVTQLARDHAEALASAQRDWENGLKTRLASQHEALTALYEQQLAELNAQLTNERASAEKAARTATLLQRRLEEARAADYEGSQAAMRRIVEAAEAQRVRADRAHHDAMEATVVTHARALDDLTAKFKRERETLLRQSTDEAEHARRQLVAAHESALESLQQQHASAVRALHESFQVQRTSEALALRAEMAHKLKALRTEKDQDHARVVAETQAVHEARYASLEARHEAVEASLVQRSSERETLRATLESKTQLFHERVAALEGATRDEVERLKLAAKRDMDKLLAENLAETRQLSDQFEETRRLMLDKVVFLKQTVGEWEDRYARRESRAEDVARIAALEQRAADKDALVRRTLDEMAYVKRELLNREEMYNKTFARTPNVGVLQVLKPHVLLQNQNQHQHQTPTQGIPGRLAATPPPCASSSATATRGRAKPMARGEKNALEVGDHPSLLRRGSERGTPGAAAAKKALPPLLGSNNQAVQ